MNMLSSSNTKFHDIKLSSMQGHNGGVRFIDIDEYERLIVSASRDRTVKLWSLDVHKRSSKNFTGSALATYNGHRKTGLLISGLVL